jgi:hypothetical protein
MNYNFTFINTHKEIISSLSILDETFNPSNIIKVLYSNMLSNKEVISCKLILNNNGRLLEFIGTFNDDICILQSNNYKWNLREFEDFLNNEISTYEEVEPMETDDQIIASIQEYEKLLETDLSTEDRIKYTLLVKEANDELDNYYKTIFSLFTKEYIL